MAGLMPRLEKPHWLASFQDEPAARIFGGFAEDFGPILDTIDPKIP